MKFPLLVDHPGYFAINKPAGIACFRHDWTLGKPDVSMALRREILNEKPQLKALGMEGLFRVYRLDAELSGRLWLLALVGVVLSQGLRPQTWRALRALP